MVCYPKCVVIEEQGLRDGLQSENRIIPTPKKQAIIATLLKAGLKRIQVTAFVHPNLVPQLADAKILCRQLDHTQNVVYSGLVLNLKGLQRAVDAGLRHVAISISASDTHSRKNANASLSEAQKKFQEMVKTAKRYGLSIRGGLQCVFGCRFEGRVDPNLVLDLVKLQLDHEVDEIALADSTGMAHPNNIQQIASQVMALSGEKPVFLHLHDTEGKGLANVLAAMSVGVSHFDTAFGGMGGCPFIKGASGNIATEDLIHMLGQMGIETGIDIQNIAAVSRDLEAFMGRSFSGKMHKLFA
jgi:hydroxymethylglutaryl-CoA lyase